MGGKGGGGGGGGEGGMGAVLLTVRRSNVGNEVVHSTLLDRACACAHVPTKIFLNIIPTAFVKRPRDPQRNFIFFYFWSPHGGKFDRLLLAVSLYKVYMNAV